MLPDEARDARHDLRDRSRGRHIVQRNRNVEAILELRDDFENLQGIEPEIGHQIVVERRLDRPPADVLQHADDTFFYGGGGGLGHR